MDEARFLDVTPKNLGMDFTETLFMRVLVRAADRLLDVVEDQFAKVDWTPIIHKTLDSMWGK